MKKLSSIKNLLGALLLVMAVQGLDGCQSSKQSSSAGDPAAPPAGPALPNKSADTLEGPGHTGGGNGINYKLYESYIIDPTELPAFKKIQPIIEQMQKDYAPRYSDQTGKDLFLSLFKFKTWYLIPQSLKAISNDVLGILSTETSDQYALQTDVAILIDTHFFQKMSVDDQAELLLHEYMMNLYLLKFVPYKSLCDFSYKVSGTQTCNLEDLDNLGGLLDWLYKPENPRPLDETDYDFIRSVTNELWKNGATIQSQDLSHLLISHNFDHRFFDNVTPALEKQKSVELSFNQLSLLFEKSLMSHALPTVCNSILLNKTIPCQLELGEDVLEIGADQKIPVGKVTIRKTEDKTILGQTYFSKTGKFYVDVGASDGATALVVQLTLSDLRLYLDKKPGKVGYDTAVVFSMPKNKLLNDLQWDDLSITSVSTFPMVFVGTGDEYTNKDGQKCTDSIYSNINPQKSDEDIISDGDGRWAKFIRSAMGSSAASHPSTCSAKVDASPPEVKK